MNVYDKVEEVLTALDEVATAIGALTAFGHGKPLAPIGAVKERLLAFMPGYQSCIAYPPVSCMRILHLVISGIGSTAEKNALEAWEVSVAKDGRRAVQLLLRDYREQKAKLEALLAAELP